MIARLYALADDHWPQIDAHYANVNLIQMPVYRFLNCVYTWIKDRIPQDKQDQFEMMLAEPLAAQNGKRTVSPMTEEEEGLAFMAAMGALNK